MRMCWKDLSPTKKRTTFNLFLEIVFRKYVELKDKEYVE